MKRTRRMNEVRTYFFHVSDDSLNSLQIRSLLAERWRKRKMSIDELPTMHVLIGGTVNLTIRT
jgi:hypothetical protein